MRLRRFIGDKAFYKMAFAVALPIMVQSGVTSFVNLLDNLMVGSMGTESIGGVSIANQLMFVFNLCIFGGLAGAGIFGAQFHGKGDVEGVRSVFRIKLIIAFVLTAAAASAFWFFSDTLIGLFLHESGEGGDLALTLREGKSYLHIMLLGLPFFALAQCYTGTLRETGETQLPMRAGIAAVAVNVVFNYILIYGKLGAPALGVKGAAVATVISRVVETVILAVWTHVHREKKPFIIGAFKSLRMPRALWAQVNRKGLPLLINEFFWSSGMSFLMQCYSMRGLNVVAAMNISNTVTNLFAIGFLSLGNAVGIIVGNLLGADRMEEAVDTDGKLIFLSVTLSAALAIPLAGLAPFIPNLYNTGAQVRLLATRFMWVYAFFMPVQAFCNAAFFTLRAGGRALITVVFDSVFLWGVSVVTAFCISRFTDMPVLPMYIAVNAMDLIKVVMGILFVKKRIWVRNITHIS